ncbi:hypothetical protein P4H71_16535 [Paenibacillus kribbensis]|nr:hypothetical protein [Paenibacillus kribbensis]EHS57988.1 hypothetical protein WG8_2153 [Paenibacillus sp. Aloe-11]MEC0235939.1 hypothetical protein [Paenibacillus kribbensis]
MLQLYTLLSGTRQNHIVFSFILGLGSSVKAARLRLVHRSGGGCGNA